MIQLNEDEYWYCNTHKKCLLVEDKPNHIFADCLFTIETFRYKAPTRKKARDFIAQSIIDQEKARNLIPEKNIKLEKYTTLPLDAITIDTPPWEIKEIF